MFGISLEYHLRFFVFVWDKNVIIEFYIYYFCWIVLATKVILMEHFLKINTVCGCLEQITKSTAENDDQYLVLMCKSAFLFLDL